MQHLFRTRATFCNNLMKLPLPLFNHSPIIVCIRIYKKKCFHFKWFHMVGCLQKYISTGNIIFVDHKNVTMVIDHDII